MKTTSTLKTLFALFLLMVPGAASAQDAAALSVSEVQIGTEYVDGAVTTPTTSISRAAGRIYAVVRVANPARGETTIRVALESTNGPERPGVELAIPARATYRTVARFPSSQAPGTYRVVVRTAEGETLQSVDLTITE